jgi:hypothetical protein
LTKTSKTYNEEKIVSSTMMQGKLDIGMQKTVQISIQSGLRTLIQDLKL